MSWNVKFVAKTKADAVKLIESHARKPGDTVGIPEEYATVLKQHVAMLRDDMVGRAAWSGLGTFVIEVETVGHFDTGDGNVTQRVGFTTYLC